MPKKGEEFETSEKCELEALYEHIPGMVRASLIKTLRETRCGFAVIQEVIDDIGSQVIIDMLSGEISMMRDLRTRIRSLCFKEIDHMKHNQTGQDYANDGDERPFEGPREGVGDMRNLEDICDLEGMSFDTTEIIKLQYSEEDKDSERIKSKYKYFIQECHAVYRSLENNFLKRFFIEWLINNRDPREIGQMIRKKGGQAGISTKRISQLRGIIIDRLCDMSELTPMQAARMLECLPAAIEHLAGGTSPKQLFDAVGEEEREFQGFSEVDIGSILNIDKGPLYVPEFLPELVREDFARNRRTEAILRLSDRLDDFMKNPEQYCLGDTRPLYDHQYEKLRTVAEYLRDRIDSDERLFIADIAPPGAGKTYIQAVLARLMDIPFVFVTPSNAVIDGSDGALATFSTLFPQDELGIVDKQRKQFGRTGTLTTYNSFASASTLREIMTRQRNEIPFLFLLDEGDLAQSELRQRAIDAIFEAIHYPVICAYSATTTVSGRYLGDVAEIVDEMDIYELIKAGKAKHVLGFYVDVGVKIESKNIASGTDEKHVDFASLGEEEQEVFINSPLQIILQNHAGERGIVHCISIEHAERMAERLSENGIKAKCISGKQTGEQMDMKREYIMGRVDVLCSCEYLGRGFSEHGVTNFVIFARLSSSVTSLYQKVGRGFRPNKTNPILVIYQIVSSDIRARGFELALLKHIFPMQFNRSLEGDMRINDMRTRLIEMIQKGELEFIGSIGGSTPAMPGIRIITENKLTQIINTADTVGIKELEIDEDNIDILFRPICSAFIEALSEQGEEDRVSCINSSSKFFKKEVVINGGRIKGGRFIYTVLRILCDIHMPAATRYTSLGILLTREWYKKGRRPTREFIVAAAKKEDERIKLRLHVTEENIEELFKPAMDQLVASSEEEDADLNWFSWRVVMGLPDIEIKGKRIKANTFFVNTIAILLGTSVTRANRYKRLGASLMIRWYLTGIRPRREFVRDSLGEEKKEREGTLQISEENIDRYFPIFMEAFRIEAGGEEGDSSWIKSGPIMESTIIEIEDGKIRAATFAYSVCSILTGLPKSEAQNKWALTLCILKEWYDTRKRPTRGWCLAQKDKLDSEKTKKLKITASNADRLFNPTMTALIKASGREGCDWCHYNSLREYEVEVEGKTINGGTFVNQVFKVLTGVGVKEAAGLRGFSAELIKSWYKTGTRPDQAYIASNLTKLREKKGSRLKITEENVDEKFMPIMEVFSELAEADKGSTDWITTNAMSKLKAMVAEKYIKGDDFMFSVASILLGVNKHNIRNMLAVSRAIVTEWYVSGKKPSQEWCKTKNRELKEDKKKRIKRR